MRGNVSQPNNRGEGIVRVLLLSAAIVVADQVSKMLVRGLSLPFFGIRWEGLPRGASSPVLGDFFRLTYVENPGMAFGIELGGKIFFSVFSIFFAAGAAIVTLVAVIWPPASV